jgi:HSP20 family molecular chaperone IbpA
VTSKRPSGPSIQVFALRQPFVAFESRVWRPAHNLYETSAGAVLVVELAGVEPATLHVHVDPRGVRVHGDRQLAVPQGIRRVDCMEIISGPFQLEVPLGRAVQAERAEARYSAGLLEVWLPYAERPEERVVVVRIDGGAR